MYSYLGDISRENVHLVEKNDIPSYIFYNRLKNG